jgi:beta-ribofuranosylaminobenzene 5'-phosphate synthase
VNGNFDEFSESLYRYGYQAGMLFSKRQGGAYAGPRASEMVEWLRGQGVRGVGQSSWGPALFALVPDLSAAEGLVGKVRSKFTNDTLQLVIAGTANSGARVESL